VSTAEQLIRSSRVQGGVDRNGKRISCTGTEAPSSLLDDLRAHRDQVALLLEKRELSALLPNGTRIVRWEPKAAPVFLTHYDKVTNVWGFCLGKPQRIGGRLGRKTLAVGAPGRTRVDGPLGTMWAVRGD